MTYLPALKSKIDNKVRNTFGNSMHKAACDIHQICINRLSQGIPADLDKIIADYVAVIDPSTVKTPEVLPAEALPENKPSRARKASTANI